ncbi:hypothetical protein THAOC_03906, partial [Thalassiosira oceanica]
TLGSLPAGGLVERTARAARELSNSRPRGQSDSRDDSPGTRGQDRDPERAEAEGREARRDQLCRRALVDPRQSTTTIHSHPEEPRGRSSLASLCSRLTASPAARLNNKMSDQLAELLVEPSRHDEVFLLYEGGEFKEEFRNKLTHVRVAPHVTKIPHAAFQGCGKLVEIEFNEGLQVIGSDAFRDCTALQNVTLPSSVIGLHGGAFAG